MQNFDPKNKTIEILCGLAKTAENMADYEDKAESQNFDFECPGSVLSDLENKHLIKKAGDSFSRKEIERLKFSKLNKVVQL